MPAADTQPAPGYHRVTGPATLPASAREEVPRALQTAWAWQCSSLGTHRNGPSLKVPPATRSPRPRQSPSAPGDGPWK